MSNRRKIEATTDGEDEILEYTLHDGDGDGIDMYAIKAGRESICNVTTRYGRKEASKIVDALNFYAKHGPKGNTK